MANYPVMSSNIRQPARPGNGLALNNPAMIHIMQQQQQLQDQINSMSRSSAANRPVAGRNIPNSMAYNRLEEARYEYESYKKPASKFMQKTMWPTMGAQMAIDYQKMYMPHLAKAAPKIAGKLDPLFGPLGAMMYGVGKYPAIGMWQKRDAYERHFAKELGKVGSASRSLDLMRRSQDLLRTPLMIALMAGGMGSAAKKIPRLENILSPLLLGAYKGVKGAAGAGASGAGGLLNMLTGGALSNFGATGVGKTLKSGLGFVGGGLDKAIAGTLGSPFGVAMAMAAAQVGLGIWKGVKMRRLQVGRVTTQGLERKYSVTQGNAQIMGQINAMAATGKVRPEQLSFMVLQVIEMNTRATEAHVSMIPELYAEVDQIRQEKTKGSSGFGRGYGREVLGHDSRSGFQKFLDRASYGVSSAINKYDPFAQLSNFIFGLARGKLVTPKGEQSKLARAYGYDSESKMAKEEAKNFGINTPQMRLLVTDSQAILRMADNYETKMLALASASYDIQRFIAMEAMTIRRDGLGISHSGMYAGADKGVFGKLINALDPRNLPVVGALLNILSLPFKAGKLAVGAYKGVKSGIKKTRDWLFGNAYGEIKNDSDAWLKKAGLYKSDQEKSTDFIAHGLPSKIEQITTYLRNIFGVLQAQYALSGKYYDFHKEHDVWDYIEKRWVTQKGAKDLEEGRKLQLLAEKEDAFMQGPLGKALWVLDVINPFTPFSHTRSYERGSKRMSMAEKTTSGLEKTLFHRPETFESKRSVNVALQSLVSEKPRNVMEPTSLKEIEMERLLRQMPGNFFWKAGAGAAGLGSLGFMTAALMGAGALTGGLGAAGSLLAYTAIRMIKKKRILQARESQIDTTSEEERVIEQIEDFFSQSLEDRSNANYKDLIGKIEDVGKQYVMPVNIVQIEDIPFTKYYEDQANKNMKQISGNSPKSLADPELENIKKIQDPAERAKAIEIYFERKRYSHVLGMASGGAVLAGQNIIVGGKGPEMFIPGSPGRIVSNRDLKQELSEVETKKEKEETKSTQKSILLTLQGILLNTKSRIFGKTVDGNKKSESGLLDYLKLLGIAGIGFGAFKFIKDFLDGYKEGGLAGAFRGFFMGPMKDDLETALGQVGKYAVLGGGIGMLVGGPLGAIGGILLGAAAGGLVSAIKGIILDSEKKGTPKAIFETIFSPEGGALAAIKGAGVWAAAGAIAGTAIAPGPGTIAGALLGGAIGGILNYIGFDKISDFMQNLPINKQMIEGFAPGTYARKFAEWGAFVPIWGPFLGGFWGTIFDILSPVINMFSSFGSWFKGKIKENFPNVFKFFWGSGESKPTTAPSGPPTSTSTGTSSSPTTTAPSGPPTTDIGYAPGPNSSAGTTSPSGPPSSASESTSNPTDNKSYQNAGKNIKEIIESAAQKTGAPLSAMIKIAASESGFKPNALNPHLRRGASGAVTPSTSVAAGLYQFVPGTWTSVIERWGSKYGLGSEYKSLDKRVDPYANAMMGGEFIANHVTELKRTGITDVNDADIYSVHFTGNTKLAKAARMNPGEPIQDFIRRTQPKTAEDAIRKNKWLQSGTVGSVYGILAKKMGVSAEGLLKKAEQTSSMVPTVPSSGSTQADREYEIRKHGGTDFFDRSGGSTSSGTSNQPTSILEQIGGAFGDISSIYNDVFNEAFNNPNGPVGVVTPTGKILPSPESFNYEAGIHSPGQTFANNFAKVQFKSSGNYPLQNAITQYKNEFMSQVKQEDIDYALQKGEKGLNDVIQSQPNLQNVSVNMPTVSKAVIDDSLDKLINGTFTSVCHNFKEDFSKYPFEANIFHTTNI